MENNTTPKPMETSKEAKEKAVELVERFKASIWEQSMDIDYVPLDNAKQCAIICVDEIMKDNQSWVTMEFWKQVKHEIQQI